MLILYIASFIPWKFVLIKLFLACQRKLQSWLSLGQMVKKKFIKKLWVKPTNAFLPQILWNIITTIFLVESSFSLSTKIALKIV